MSTGTSKHYVSNWLTRILALVQQAPWPLFSSSNRCMYIYACAHEWINIQQRIEHHPWCNHYFRSLKRCWSDFFCDEHGALERARSRTAASEREKKKKEKIFSPSPSKAFDSDITEREREKIRIFFSLHVRIYSSSWIDVVCWKSAVLTADHATLEESTILASVCISFRFRAG